MYKECTSPRTRARSLLFGRSLLQMMERQPFNEITVSALCAEAGVPRKSFYRYFDTKEDVFFLMVDTALSDCIEYCSLGPYSALDVNEERLTLCYRFWLEHRAIFDAARKSDMLSSIFSRMLHFYETRFLPDLLSPDPSDTASRLLFSVSGMFSLIIRWYSRDFDRAPEDMAKLTMELLEHPLVG